MCFDWQIPAHEARDIIIQLLQHSFGAVVFMTQLGFVVTSGVASLALGGAVVLPAYSLPMIGDRRSENYVPTMVVD